MGIETYLHSLLALIFIIGMIFMLGWAGRKFELTGIKRQALDDKHSIKIIDRLRIDQKRSILWFCAGDKSFLVLTGDKDTLLSTDLPPPSHLIASSNGEKI